MLGDPQAIQFNGVTKSLPRVGSDEDSSIYKLTEADGTEYRLELSHQLTTGKGRRRVNGRLTRTAVGVDPLTEENTISSITVSVTVDFPPNSPPTDVVNLINCLAVWSTSGGVTARLVQGEL